MSSLVPSVNVASACVSPRVNSAEPCTRGSKPTSHVDLANLVELAAIRTPPRVQHVVAENVLAQPFERALGQRALLFLFFRNRTLISSFSSSTR